MNEPKPWLEEGAPPVMEQVLRAARDEQPSPASLQRALAGLAVGTAVTGAATGASALLGGAAASSGVFVKWTLLSCFVTLGGIAGGLGISALRGAVSTPNPDIAGARAAAPVIGGGGRAAVASAATDASSADILGQKTSGQTARPLPALTSTATEPARPRQPASQRLADQRTEHVVIEDVDVLAQETRLIEQARAENAAGRAAAAIATLDEYQRRFSVQRYAPEALYLRMQALLALGDTPAATKVASQLATRYPHSPHAARAEAVRAEKIP